MATEVEEPVLADVHEEVPNPSDNPGVETVSNVETGKGDVDSTQGTSEEKQIEEVILGESDTNELASGESANDHSKVNEPISKVIRDSPKVATDDELVVDVDPPAENVSKDAHDESMDEKGKESPTMQGKGVLDEAEEDDASSTDSMSSVEKKRNWNRERISGKRHTKKKIEDILDSNTGESANDQSKISKEPDVVIIRDSPKVTTDTQDDELVIDIDPAAENLSKDVDEESMDEKGKEQQTMQGKGVLDEAQEDNDNEVASITDSMASFEGRTTKRKRKEEQKMDPTMNKYVLLARQKEVHVFKKTKEYKCYRLLVAKSKRKVARSEPDSPNIFKNTTDVEWNANMGKWKQQVDAFTTRNHKAVKKLKPKMNGFHTQGVHYFKKQALDKINNLYLAPHTQETCLMLDMESKMEACPNIDSGNYSKKVDEWAETITAKRKKATEFPPAEKKIKKTTPDEGNVKGDVDAKELKRRRLVLNKKKQEETYKTYIKLFPISQLNPLRPSPNDATMSASQFDKAIVDWVGFMRDMIGHFGQRIVDIGLVKKSSKYRRLVTMSGTSRPVTPDPFYQPAKTADWKKRCKYYMEAMNVHLGNDTRYGNVQDFNEHQKKKWSQGMKAFMKTSPLYQEFKNIVGRSLPPFVPPDPFIFYSYEEWMKTSNEWKRTIRQFVSERSQNPNFKRKFWLQSHTHDVSSQPKLVELVNSYLKRDKAARMLIKDNPFYLSTMEEAGDESGMYLDRVGQVEAFRQTRTYLKYRDELLSNDHFMRPVRVQTPDCETQYTSDDWDRSMDRWKRHVTEAMEEVVIKKEKMLFEEECRKRRRRPDSPSTYDVRHSPMRTSYNDPSYYSRPHAPPPPKLSRSSDTSWRSESGRHEIVENPYHTNSQQYNNPSSTSKLSRSSDTSWRSESGRHEIVENPYHTTSQVYNNPSSSSSSQQYNNPSCASSSSSSGLDFDLISKMTSPEDMLSYVQQKSYDYARVIDSRYPDFRKVANKIVHNENGILTPCAAYNKDNSCTHPPVHLDNKFNHRIHACTLCYFSLCGVINMHRQSNCPLLSILV